MKYALLILPLVLLLASCQSFDDFEDTSGAVYDADYALPIANSRLTIRDALKNASDLSTLRIDEEGVIHFEYFGDVITQNSDTLFERINESLSGQLVPLLANRFGLPLATAQGTSFDRLIFKAGQLSWGFQNPHPEPVTVTLRLPDVYKDGQPLELTGQAPGYNGGSSLPFYNTLLNPKDLSGYEVLPAAGTDSIYVEYELIREGVGPDSVAFGALTISNLAFSYMEGYFGQEEQKGGRDTIIIDFFDNWVNGDIYFADPTVTFRIENSFGIPTRSRVNLFNVFTVRGDVLPLEGELIDNGIDFQYPGLDEAGQTVVADYVFNKDNSNIDVILGAGPLAIDYDVDALTHPDGNTDIRGFLTDSSYYKVDIEVDLPLYGSAVDFLARDTFELGLGDLGDGAYAAEFKLVSENELPLKVALQGYFLDEAGQVLDSLFAQEQLVIDGAAADEDGVAKETAVQTTFIGFPEARFSRIKPTSRIIIVASFTTTGDGTQQVKLLADQGVDIKLGAILSRRNP